MYLIKIQFTWLEQKIKLMKVLLDVNFGVFLLSIGLYCEFRKFRGFREIRGEIFRISRNSENAKD